MSTPSTAAPSSAMSAALHAPGPWPEYADKLMLFGQFVGVWDVDITFFGRDGAVTSEGRGEWLFGWTLEGRAVQDVLIRPPRTERAELGAQDVAHAAVDDFWEYGTTVRVYDPQLDAWHVTWIAPVQGRGARLIARPDGDEIVLEGTEEEVTFRWVFSEITDDSCLWRGSASDDGGETWIVLQEMRLRRRSPQTVSGRRSSPSP
jgi:hypothetical protein